MKRHDSREIFQRIAGLPTESAKLIGRNARITPIPSSVFLSPFSCILRFKRVRVFFCVLLPPALIIANRGRKSVLYLMQHSFRFSGRNISSRRTWHKNVLKRRGPQRDISASIYLLAFDTHIQTLERTRGAQHSYRRPSSTSLHLGERGRLLTCPLILKIRGSTQYCATMTSRRRSNGAI